MDFQVGTEVLYATILILKPTRKVIMKWDLSDEVREVRLIEKFSQLNVDCEKPGFCDTEAFLEAERTNLRILESYAEFVEVRRYQPEYLVLASEKIKIVSEVIRSAVEKDGRLGACVDASAIVGRMLDKLGIWNYVAKSTLSIEYPNEAKLPNTYFFALDSREFASPHSVVIAPPFGVIDVTLKYQAYGGRQGRFLPNSVLANTFDLVEWHMDDLACDELREYLHSTRIKFLDFLQMEMPHMLEVMKALPPRQLSINGTLLKYVVVAVGGSIEPLERITSYKPSGRTALEIYESDVLPQVHAFEQRKIDEEGR